MKLSIAAMQANIHRYSMPGPASYDIAASLMFRGRSAAIARAIADEPPQGSDVLDVACGPGEVLVRVAKLAPSLRLTGLDLDAAMIGRAERKAARKLPIPATRPRFVVADVTAMPFEDASFDVVMSSYAVHHWPDRHAGLAEMMRVLRPGGRAIIWDIASPMDGIAGHGDAEAAGHGHGHNTSPHGDSPTPSHSLLGALRMVAV